MRHSFYFTLFFQNMEGCYTHTENLIIFVMQFRISFCLQNTSILFPKWCFCNHIHQFSEMFRISFQSFECFHSAEFLLSVQPVSVHGAHGHARSHTLCLGHQGAEPYLGGPGGWQADHCRRGKAGGGKELAEELHRSEPGGVTTHGISPVGPPSGSLANPPAAPARSAGVQHHLHLPQTLISSLCSCRAHADR